MRQSRTLTAAALSLGIVFAGCVAAIAGDEWSIKADISEACSCDVICPCIIGRASTHEHCEGSRLVEIRQGFVGELVILWPETLVCIEGHYLVAFVI